MKQYLLQREYTDVSRFSGLTHSVAFVYMKAVRFLGFTTAVLSWPLIAQNIVVDSCLPC